MKISPLTSNTVIGKLQSLFARWGIPDEIVCDNAGQFTRRHFKGFAKKYGFPYTTVSPHFPQANGAAESAVKIAKRILRRLDIFLALMAYHSTPCSGCMLLFSEYVTLQFAASEREFSSVFYGYYFTISSTKNTIQIFTST